MTPIVGTNISRASRLMTDESSSYAKLGREFANTQSVSHKAGLCGRGDAQSKAVDGLFSIFKDGMKGTYQMVSNQQEKLRTACDQTDQTGRAESKNFVSAALDPRFRNPRNG